MGAVNCCVHTLVIERDEGAQRHHGESKQPQDLDTQQPRLHDGSECSTAESSSTSSGRERSSSSPLVWNLDEKLSLSSPSTTARIGSVKDYQCACDACPITASVEDVLSASMLCPSPWIQATARVLRASAIYDETRQIDASLAKKIDELLRQAQGDEDRVFRAIIQQQRQRTKSRAPTSCA